ncbi:Gfo/Idh/MocA family oxidoreductase [Alkalihalobacillus sp. TS-13]|nr:Gfo/Idh/MocA family oxidoreductase [Alkalihalobacillus sp. TS-13]
MKKQILCEKPIATEVEDATAMIITCEKNGVIFTSGQNVKDII